MKHCRPAITNSSGFTLLEIAIVMVIIGILTGGGVSLMKILTERKARNETTEYLQQARAALISYAAANNGRLPWAARNPIPPSTISDGLEFSGLTNGYFPYLTLQIAPSDAYKRILRYEVNPNLTSNWWNTCAALKTGLTTQPQVVDADGASTAFSVAFVLVSAGPMDADSDGNVFDALNSGTYQGNNANGTPNYLRNPPGQNFDDLTTYIGGNELFGQMCEYVNLAVNNNSGAIVYVYDPDRLVDLFNVPGSSIVRQILSGTSIELRTATGGGGSRLSTTPPSPMALAGRGATITTPPLP
jgi:prepilin-type N-terminal cleavage/methylation domain-containing protein